MEVLDTPTRTSYIESLDLALPTGLKVLSAIDAPTIADGDEAGYVDAGSTISFVDGIDSTKQNDVLNSTLLAQLAANKKYDRETATQQWYTFYREVLENLGWTVQNFGFQKFEAAGQTITMDKAALKVITAVATGNQLAVLTATLKALEESSPDSKQVVLFDNNGSKRENGNFQLSSCEQDSNGNVAMALGAYYFKADKHQTKFLFFTWSSNSVNFYFSAQKAVLNEQIYKTVRKDVIAKLGDNAKKFVADLEI